MVHEVEVSGVYNAFEDIAKFTFTKEGHERSKAKSSIFANGDSRSTMLQQRYYTILQQIFRDSKFIDTARGKRGADFPIISFGQSNSSTDEAKVNSSSLLVIHDKDAPQNWRFEVTPVESLPGSTGVKVVFGMLSRGVEGRLILEDIHQSVTVKMDSVIASDDYITENTFVLAKGEMVDEIFNVSEMTLPPVPLRSLCEGSVNTSGGPGDLTEEVLTHAVGEPPEDTSLAIVSKIAMDDPVTIEKLDQLLTGFEEVDAIPSMYVLMGDFVSKKFNPYSGDSLRAFQKGFEAMAQILSRHPKTLEHSRIVIVPGSLCDPATGMLPQPPFADSLVRGLSTRFPNVVLGSNPCRIRTYNKQIVFFNGAIVSGLRKARIVGNGAPDESEDDSARLSRCVLSQMHLSPGPARDKPIVWDHDQGLRLYPPPHALFLSDPDLKPFQAKSNEETLVTALPNFSGIERLFEFHLYHPDRNESEISDLSSS